MYVVRTPYAYGRPAHLCCDGIKQDGGVRTKVSTASGPSLPDTVDDVTRP